MEVLYLRPEVHRWNVLSLSPGLRCVLGVLWAQLLLSLRPDVLQWEMLSLRPDVLQSEMLSLRPVL